MGFSTLSYDLIDLFARIDRGDLQLPDFQRDYSWDVDRIRALIVTVLRGYPMGCLMALDTRNEKMRFRPRPLEGAPNTGNNPGMLLLDGQQRLTTLYHSLQGDGIVDTVDFRNKRIRRKFYVDVNKALSADILPLEAVFSVNEKGVVKSHFGPDIPGGVTDRETALAAGVIPVSALLSDEGTDMIFDLAEGPDLVGETATAFTGSARDRAKHFHNTVAKPLIRYSVPMIRLDRETAQGGVGSIFAQANSAGLQMDVFDLLTAVFANEDPDFKLRDDWADIETTLRQYPALDSVGRTEFLTAVALFVTAQEGYASGQREDILRLNLPTYRAASAAIRAAFVETAEFLRQRCIVDPSLVPYRLLRSLPSWAGPPNSEKTTPIPRRGIASTGGSGVASSANCTAPPPLASAPRVTLMRSPRGSVTPNSLLGHQRENRPPSQMRALWNPGCSAWTPNLPCTRESTP